jgi:hypothetical protein
VAGNANSGRRKDDKFWCDAVRLAAMAEDKQGRIKLRVLAEKVVAMALEGDMAAIKEVADRLDGCLSVRWTSGGFEPTIAHCD